MEEGGKGKKEASKKKKGKGKGKVELELSATVDANIWLLPGAFRFNGPNGLSRGAPVIKASVIYRTHLNMQQIVIPALCTG